MHSTGSLCSLQKRQQQQQETAWRKASLAESVVKVRSLCLTFHRHLCRVNSPVCFQPRWLLAARPPALPRDCPAHEWSLPALGFNVCFGWGAKHGTWLLPCCQLQSLDNKQGPGSTGESFRKLFSLSPFARHTHFFFPSHGTAKLIVVYQLKHCQTTSPGIPPPTALCSYSK